MCDQQQRGMMNTVNNFMSFPSSMGQMFWTPDLFVPNFVGSHYKSVSPPMGLKHRQIRLPDLSRRLQIRYLDPMKNYASNQISRSHELSHEIPWHPQKKETKNPTSSCPPCWSQETICPGDGRGRCPTCEQHLRVASRHRPGTVTGGLSQWVPGKIWEILRKSPGKT